MSKKALRAASCLDYETAYESPTVAELQLGAIQRIADATEKMAQRHTDLIRERDSFEKNAHYFKRELDRELRRSAALRGQITKLKKRLAIAQTQAFGGDPAEYALAKGCHRSHPHENMSDECKRKTVEARRVAKEAGNG